MTLFDKLFTADERLSARLRVAEKPGLIRTAAVMLAHSGDSPYWIAGFLLVLWRGSSFWQNHARLDLIGIAATAAVIQLIKWIVRRPRPQGEWGQGYRKIDPHSFPSGHAARAALLATLAVFLGPPEWFFLLLIWAPLVALARVAMGVHYLSDILAGAACGAVCGAIVVIAF